MYIYIYIHIYIYTYTLYIYTYIYSENNSTQSFATQNGTISQMHCDIVPFCVSLPAVVTNKADTAIFIALLC